MRPPRPDPHRDESDTISTTPDLRSRLRAHLPNILAVGTGKVVAMVGLALGTRLLTEVASTSTFGEAKLIIGINTLIFGIFFGPFSRFVMREFHDADRDGTAPSFQRYVRQVSGRFGAGLALPVALGFLAYSLIFGAPARFTALLAGAIFLFESRYTIEYALLITRNRQIWASTVDSLKLLGLPLLAAALVVAMGDRSGSIVLAHLFVMVLVGWGARFALRDTATRIDAEPSQIRRWNNAARAFVVPMLPLALFQWVVAIGDRYILAYFWSSAEVGQYSAVYGLIATPLTALGAMASSLVYPQWFRRAASGDPGSERKIQLFMLGAQVTLAVFAFGGVALLAELLSTLFLGASFRPGASGLMIWIAGGACCLLISTVLDMKAYASKRVKVVTLSYGIAAVVNVTMNLILVPRSGPLGAAQATAATFAIYLGTMLFLTFRKPRMRRFKA